MEQFCLVLPMQPGQHDDAPALMEMGLTDERELDELDAAARSIFEDPDTLREARPVFPRVGSQASLCLARQVLARRTDPRSVGRLNKAGRHEVSGPGTRSRILARAIPRPVRSPSGTI